MISLIDGNLIEFIKEISGKKVFCFGGGNQFCRFVCTYPFINIAGVIDSYLSKIQKEILVYGKGYSLLSLQEYISHHIENSILVITVKNYGEIVDLLDLDERLQGTKCFIASILMKDFEDVKQYHVALKELQEHNKRTEKDVYFTARNKIDKVQRFQVWDCVGEGMHAGSKAPHDIMEIAGSMGYQRMDVHPWQGSDISSAVSWTKNRNWEDWERCYRDISNGAIVLLQHPFWQWQPERETVLQRLKTEKKIRIVSLVHDVEELRKAYYTDDMRREFHFMLSVADVFIVHSDQMKRFFLNHGIRENSVLVLGIFDYLAKQNSLNVSFEKSVVIAGNLDPCKGKYVEHLGDISGVFFHLFGSGYVPKSRSLNVRHHGAYPMEELIGAMVGSFGLVWNGDSLDTCDGDMGNYLRYNSPHKLSLYIAAGIPPIVWKESASAAFVRDYGIGLEISSLYELPEVIGCVTSEQYREFTSRVKLLSLALRQGAFTRTALERAEMVLSGISKESEVVSV